MKSISVMVVGDERSAKAVDDMLNGDYVLTFEKSSSADIIQKVVEVKPDLVIMDINTPDDLKTLQALKDGRETENVAVMAAVGRDDIKLQERAIDLGATDCLEKPFNSKIAGNRIFHFTEKAELLQMAFVDGLTQINNRRSFDIHIDNAWEHSMKKHRSLAVVMFDIDCFKLYNDTYGHYQGDRALRRVAREASAAIRRNDFIARYGGEEFVAVLRRTTIEEALEVAERIRKAVEAAALLHENTKVEFAPNVKPSVTVSVGVAACFPNKTLNMQGLMNLADQSLYKAKSQGRNQVCGDVYVKELKQGPICGDTPAETPISAKAILADARIMGRNPGGIGKPLEK